MNAFFFVNRNLTCFVSWIIYYRIYMATGEIVRRENAKSSLGFHETKAFLNSLMDNTYCSLGVIF
jgi:hypothetical protein